VVAWTVGGIVLFLFVCFVAGMVIAVRSEWTPDDTRELRSSLRNIPHSIKHMHRGWQIWLGIIAVLVIINFLTGHWG
jgi:hypothetical protein